MLYSEKDYSRENDIHQTKDSLQLRSPFRRDFARLIHSPAFRRLQGKTQLFPGLESDFFRNRLTHSLEVAQIAKSIAIRINQTILKDNNQSDKIDLDLVEFAGLAHDLGHPPFGHNGEKALDECMRDFGGFEGNAQTLRILARLEKKGAVINPFSGPKGSDTRIGLNLTYRTLAAVLKYDRVIPIHFPKKSKPLDCDLIKGYYKSEEKLVKKIKKSVIGASGYKKEFKTIECQIMDVADDIAYSTYDLEDALKAEFLSPMEILNDSLNQNLMTAVAKKVSKKLGSSFTWRDAGNELFGLFFEAGLFPIEKIQTDLANAETDDAKYFSVARQAVDSYNTSLLVSKNGYRRNQLTSGLVDKFINGIECTWNPDAPPFSKVIFSENVFSSVETLKNYTYEKLIQSSRLKVAEFRGYQIVRELFNTLDDGGASLLPEDFKELHDTAPNEVEKKRVICDFIAGMTDDYAIEFYGRLNSESPQSIFVPL